MPRGTEEFRPTRIEAVAAADLYRTSRRQSMKASVAGFAVPRAMYRALRGRETKGLKARPGIWKRATESGRSDMPNPAATRPRMVSWWMACPTILGCPCPSKSECTTEKKPLQIHDGKTQGLEKAGAIRCNAWPLPWKQESRWSFDDAEEHRLRPLRGPIPVNRCTSSHRFVRGRPRLVRRAA
jgi:hypothetical protein